MNISGTKKKNGFKIYHTFSDNEISTKSPRIWEWEQEAKKKNDVDNNNNGNDESNQREKKLRNQISDLNYRKWKN